MKLVKKIIKKLYHLIWFLSIFFLFSSCVNAAVVNYQYFDRAVGGTFSVGSQSSADGRTYFVVTGDSTRSYLVIDLCSTVGDNFSNSVPADYDGSFTTFYKMYNLKSSCTVSGYGGDKVRLFYYIKTWGDAGNGNSAINNYTRIINNAGYTGVFEVLSVTLSDNIDLGDLTINNQNIIINEINNISSSITNNSNSIINNNNSNKQDIINNNNSNKQDIIDNNNSNRQQIIQNQDENTNKQIESQKVCKNVHYSYNRDSSNLTVGKNLSDTGQEITSSSYSITPYLKLSEGNTILLQSSNYMNISAFCFYKKDKSLISCEPWSRRTSVSVVAPTNTYYIRSSIGGPVTVTIDGTFCSDGNQAISDDLNSLNDSITNDDSPTIDLSLNEVSDTPISDLLTMPLTILNSLNTNLNGTCSNYTMPFFFNTSVTFPCFSLSDYLGTTVTNYIDLFICLYMCYNIAMLCITMFDDITSLNDIFNSLYTPRHASTDYKPKHGGD